MHLAPSALLGSPSLGFIHAFNCTDIHSPNSSFYVQAVCWESCCSHRLLWPMRGHQTYPPTHFPSSNAHHCQPGTGVGTGNRSRDKSDTVLTTCLISQQIQYSEHYSEKVQSSGTAHCRGTWFGMCWIFSICCSETHFPPVSTLCALRRVTFMDCFYRISCTLASS